LFELINKDHLHVELKVFEKDAHKVKEGQDVIFTKKDGTNSIAKIFLVGKTFDEATKTVNIHVHFEDIQLENELIVGQLIKGTILINGSKVNAINESAIKREEFGNYVFTIENENSKETRIVKHKVEIGKIQKGMVQLLNFNTNKKIVSSGINFIETIEVEEE
jgi:membrane fusion protein, heavy metal efflux system